MSNERVSCVLLIGCGLSLEGVGGIAQGGPGGGSAQTGFEEETRETLRGGARTSLHAQR